MGLARLFKDLKHRAPLLYNGSHDFGFDNWGLRSWAFPWPSRGLSAGAAGRCCLPKNWCKKRVCLTERSNYIAYSPKSCVFFWLVSDSLPGRATILFKCYNVQSQTKDSRQIATSSVQNWDDCHGSGSGWRSQAIGQRSEELRNINFNLEPSTPT